MENSPAIVVVAYNRPKSLDRLLKSINKAVYPDGMVDLIISIDKSDNLEVVELAEKFEWKGNKQIIRHDTNLGLHRHILSCGDLSFKYGSVIILEDDLLVSPYFYSYAQETLKVYGKDEKIGGISFYKFEYNESAGLPFYALCGQSVFLMQTASSWGQMFTLSQWEKFRRWYKSNQVWDNGYLGLPEYMRKWSDKSWKKYYNKYLVENALYFVYPPLSLTTNFGDEGENICGFTTNSHQVSLQQTAPHIEFEPQVLIKYDTYFQVEEYSLKKMVPYLNSYDFDVDLYGNKPSEILEKEYTLTTKKSTNPAKLFGVELYPPELNIINEIEGNEIYLVNRENIVSDKPFNYYKFFKYLYKLQDDKIQYINNQLPPLRKQVVHQIKYWWLKMFSVKKQQ